MKSSKLVNILKTFSKEEMVQFEKFVASPFHNSGKNCKPLLRELKRFYPGFDHINLRYEYLYKRLYPGKKFNRQVMWNLASAMEKMAKEFLEQVALEKNKFNRIGLLLSELGSRKLLNNFSNTLNEMEKQLESGGIDYDYFENKGHLENYKQEYYHLLDKIQPMSDSKLKATEYQIMLFLRMTVGGLNDMTLLSKNYNARFDVNIPMEFAKHIDLKSIVDYARSKNFEYAFLIEIYYHSLMLFLEPEETSHLDKVRELYMANFNRFTLSEKRNMMHWIINYCLRRSEHGEEIKYKRLVFELNKFRLKEGFLFYPEGQLPRAIYFQILNAALTVKENEWAADFIKNYTSTLQPEIQDSMRALAYGFLHFETREYEKVLNDLNKVEFVDVRDKLFTRVLMAKTYYEVSELEPLLSYIDSSLHFLVNNTAVSEIVRFSHSAFFNLLKKMALAKANCDFSSLLLLRSKTVQEESIVNRKWLQEKLEELEKTHTLNTT